MRRCRTPSAKTSSPSSTRCEARRHAVERWSAACGPDGCDPPDPDAGPPPPDDAGAPVDTFHDPLSLPEEPTLFPGNFTPARFCGECHETHYAQWKTSMHSYATVDPVWRAIVKVRQADFGGTQDQFCVQCHSPIATRGGEVPDNFSFDDFSEIALDGVSCETCHKARVVERTFNSGLFIDEFGPMRGPIEDPEPSSWHSSEFDPMFDRSQLCGACHDVVEVSGLNLERPFAEWLESPARENRVQCQGCHMPTYEGRAVEDAPVRTLHDHRFVGVDVPLSDDFFENADELAAHRERVAALLDGAGSLSLAAPTAAAAGETLNLLVHLKNEIDAHNLPTGSTFIRQMWVEVIARDAAGEVLYETGTLDGNGDLRSHFSELDPYGDDDLLTLTSTLVNDTGAPEIFPWRATEHVSNSISPGYARTHTLFVPLPDDASGTITVDARLLFRSHPPYLLRALALDEYVDKLEIFEVDTATLAIDLGS
jgi:hypothetical protein